MKGIKILFYLGIASYIVSMFSIGGRDSESLIRFYGTLILSQIYAVGAIIIINLKK